MEAQNSCDIISNMIGNNHYLNDMDMDSVAHSLSQLSINYDGRVMIINEDYKIVKDTYSMSTGKTLLSETVFRCFAGESASYYNAKRGSIEVVSPIREPGSKKIIGVLFMNTSMKQLIQTKEYLSERVHLLLLAVTIVLLCVSVVASLFLFRPFKRIGTIIGQMAEGYGADAMEVTTYQETEEISEAFNKLWNRMRVLDESRQEFVSNVSHELKTPITSMKVLADSLLMLENASVDLYKEFMSDIAEEIDRESKIISDLLSLVKMDKTSADLNIASCDINGLVELILKRLRPIAAGRNIELVFESFRPVTADVDEMKLSLAISNLVENAIKYNRENGWVHVSLNADHKYFFIKVEDSGIGIPEQDVEHIFERFYRVDKSHSREIGGTGLGLAITRSAIIMHRGAIKVYSKEQEGTTFTVRIPLNYIV